MKSIVVDQGWDGRRLTRFLQKTLPAAGMGQIRKFLRLGRVKVDGKRPGEDFVLAAGQRVELYVEDSFFEAPEREDPFYSKIHPKLSILYEDAQVMLLDKRAGLVCHPDEGEKVHTLLTYAQAYLYQKGEWRPGAGFAPALCNRIDRMTCGIVILAKTPEALRAMDAKIRTREVEKYYLCIVHGRMKHPEGTLAHLLIHRPGEKKVAVARSGEPGAKEAVTYYRAVDERGGLTLCECLLGTGRTHQIRAQFAAIGHPLLGDNQYGSAKRNAPFGMNGQALCAYRLHFAFDDRGGVLEGIGGRTFQVRDVPFVREFFPDVVIPQP
ncbi:MAG: RluA family pseudouridine synthase [Clostridiales bacterium]|nr:RluA family pseudouridine synthase [Clostridiales bacterium]MDY5514094.1 RluA family pseudouridine synthase [Candidatus Ventricola sp.]